MCDPKQQQVLGGDLFEKRPGDLPLHRKVPDGIFCCVVVPRDTVSLKESKTAISITLKALLIFSDQLTIAGCLVNIPPIESIDRLAKFAEMPFLQPIFLFHLKDRYE